MQRYPVHSILPADDEHPLFKQLHQKRIGFSPFAFCEFFQGFDVLQMQSNATKEYIFALYFSGQLVGHVYLGDQYSEDDILTIKKQFFPPTWEDISEYMKRNPGVWYMKYAPEQYAFVFEKCLQKIY